MRALAIALVWMVGITSVAAAGPDPVEAAKQAVAAQPNDPALRIKLAELLAARQDIRGAIAAYEAAIALDTRAPGPKLALANLYIGAHDLERAVTMLHDVVRTSNDIKALVRAGREAVDIEEMTGTLGELEQVLLPLAAQPIHRGLLVELYARWVPRLVQGAHRGDAAARAELLRIGTAAFKPLMAALVNTDPRQPLFATSVLPYLGNPAAAPALVNLARAEPKAPGGTKEWSDEIELQWRALVAAGQLGSPVVFEAALPLMKHARIATRDAATFTVARTGDRRAIAPLIAMLGQRRISSATLAGLALARYRDPRVGPALLAVVSDAGREDVVRAACAYALGFQRLAGGVPVLTRALEGSGELARIAAWSLGQIADPATLPPLLDAYFARGGQKRPELELAIVGAGSAPAPGAPNPDPAAYPLRGGRYDPARAVAMLPGELPPMDVPDHVFQAHAGDIARAVASALSSSDPAVVLGVFQDLDASPDTVGFGGLTPRSPGDGDAATRAALATILAGIEPTLTSQLANGDLRVRAHALSVLTKAVGSRAEPAILKALDEPEQRVREGAMAAIGQLARQNLVSGVLRARVVRALASPYLTDRRTAALTMGDLGAAADVAALAAAAGDPSAFVREAVATSLGAIASPATVAALIRLSRDEIPQVRVAAASALRPLGDPRARKRTSELRGDPDPRVRAAAGP